MKKGFTLVELLAVITILAVIALVTTPVVNTIKNNAKEKAKDIQVKSLIKATKDLVVEHNTILDNFDNANKIYITVDYLISMGYIDQEEVIDPNTNSIMNGCVTIIEKYNNYVYDYLETCTVPTTVGDTPSCLSEGVCTSNEAS